MITPEALALPLRTFGIAVVGKLLQVGQLAEDLDAMLNRVGESAATSRQIARSPQWDSLIEQADALQDEKAWTIGEISRLDGDDPRAQALHAPLLRMLLDGYAQMRETQVLLFPPFVWSSVVVAVLAEWEVALRMYPEYLSHHLGIPGLDRPDALGARLMDEFKGFTNGPLDLGFDFSLPPWGHMNRHRDTRNLIVHWGARLVGPKAEAHRQFVQGRPKDFEVRGNQFLCRRPYAEAVARDAVDVVIAFDEALARRFPDLAA